MRLGIRGLLLGVLLLLPVPEIRAEEERGLGPVDTPGYWLRQAETYTRAITVPDARAALLVSIGTGYVEAGETEHALDLLRAAVEYGSKCTGCFAKAKRLADIGLLLTKAGDPLTAARAFDAAREAADELEDPVLRIDGLCLLAERRAEAGDVMPARIALAEVEGLVAKLDGITEVEACSVLVPAWIAVGEGAKARAAFEPIRRFGPKDAESGDEVELARALGSQALLDLTVGAIEAGDFELARERADAIADLEVRLDAWQLISRGEHAAGHPFPEDPALARAVKITRGIEDRAARAAAVLDLAATASANGDTVAATLALASLHLLLAPEIVGEPTARVVELRVAWADRSRDLGDRETAGEALVWAEEGVDALAEAGDDAATGLRRLLAGAWARQGELGRIERALAAIEDDATRARARLDVAETRREAGSVGYAVAMAEPVRERFLPAATDPASEEAAARGELLRRLAVFQVACGHFAAAIQTVKAIDRPFQSATACTYIARDLTR